MKLDKYQQAVVFKNIEEDSALRVVANAGAGKSTTMLYKAQQLALHQKSSSIVMVSFSRKSREDLANKWKKISKDAPPLISTLHSFGLIIIRQYLKLNFNLAKPYEQQRIVKHILEECKFDYDPAINIKAEIFKVLGAISFYKSKNIDEKDLKSIGKQDTNLKTKDLLFVLQKYSQHLRDNNLYDFDDLIYRTYRELLSNPDILAKVRKKFRTFIVDEAQDLNRANWDLIFLLSKGQRLIAVGDPCQNIYLFRYAEPTLFGEKEFLKYFSNTATLQLPNNYRSTKEIVDFGNLIREYNKDELTAIPKIASNPSSLKIYTESSAHLEGKTTIKIVNQLVAHGYKLSDIVVISRSSNFLKHIIEKDCITANLPYKILAGQNAQNFHDTNSAVMIMAMISLLINPNNMVAYTTLIPFMNGMGEFTRQKGGFEKLGKNGELYTKLILKHNKVGVSTNNSKLDALVQQYYAGIIARIDDLKEGLGFELVLDKLYDLHLLHTKEANKITKKQFYRIRCTVMNFIDDYFDRTNKEPLSKSKLAYQKAKTIKTAIMDMLLNVDGYEPEETSDKLTLATVHSQKGLESKVTIACGFRAYGEKDDMGDECNILYVQLSRAIEKLIILRSKNFRRMGGYEVDGAENIHLSAIMDIFAKPAIMTKRKSKESIDESSPW